MSEIEKLVEKLRSPKAVIRYEACKLLRVSPTIPPEAIAALEKVLHDPNLAVVESAASALQVHQGIAGRPGQPPEPQQYRWADLPVEYLPALLLPLFVAFVFFSAHGYSHSSSS
jgi:hypothetical protein